MGKKINMAIGLLATLTILIFAILVETSQQTNAMVALLPELNGFGAAPLAFFDALLVMTVIFYALALVMPHNRLALVQALLITVYGLVIFIGGLVVAFLALTKLLGLISLLLAFPFGTIAYFAKYTCGSDPGASIVLMPQFALQPVLGKACFDGTIAASWFAMFLKILALIVLLITSVKFVKVTGLLVLSALSLGISAGLTIALFKISSLSFLLYPADAGLTIVVALIAAIYGVCSFVKGLFALAMAIAGQVA